VVKQVSPTKQSECESQASFTFFPVHFPAVQFPEKQVSFELQPDPPYLLATLGIVAVQLSV